MHRAKHSPLYYGILTLFILILTACGAGGNQFIGTQWRLTELNGRTPLASAEPLTLKFDSAEQAGGNSGCNSFGGSYRTTGSNLAFGPLASTERACADPALMAQEAAFYQALGVVTAFELNNGQLTLKDSAGAAVLRFAQIS